MAVPAYTVYANRPRLFCRDTQKTELTARTNSSAQHQALWDGAITTRANQLKGFTDAQIVSSSPHLRLLVLCFYGWIEEAGRPVNSYRDKAIKAAIYLAGLPDNPDSTLERRERMIAHAAVFDFCFDVMTTSEKNTIAGEMLQQADRRTNREDEKIDGHSGTDQAAALGVALTLHGYSTFTAQAATIILEALTFWHGESPDWGRLDMTKYQSSDGGHEKGSFYSWWSYIGEYYYVKFLKNGTTNIDIVTEMQNSLGRLWEWLLWTHWRGGVDKDYEAMGDNDRLGAPRMHHVQRWLYGELATLYPDVDSKKGGDMLRWLFDQWSVLTPASGADDQILDVINIDKSLTTPTHPKDTTPVPATSRLFSPPGVYYYRQAGRGSGDADWDDKSVVFRVSARKRYYLGHAHLDAGSVQIRFKDDVLLLAPGGYYDGFGASHHSNAFQRSWLQSLCPLIHDPSQSYQRYSVAVANDGGQHFKKYVRQGSAVSDPWNVFNMKNEGGGEAWLRTRRFEKKADTGNLVFLVADIEPGYRKFHTDVTRAAIIEIKYLVIKPSAANGLVYPALLYYARIRKTDPDWKVQIPMHSVGAWTSQSYGFTTTGWRTVAGDGSPGKLWVDIRDIANFTRVNVPPGTPADANGYGPDQFRIGGAGTNYKPSTAVKNNRFKLDIKVHSAYVEKTTKVQEEHYVFFLAPTAAADSAPPSLGSWITDAAQPNYYGKTIGSETFLVHRTQDEVVFGTPDTTPPAEVTAQSLLARDRALQYSFTDPADSDYKEAEVFIRTSAT